MFRATVVLSLISLVVGADVANQKDRIVGGRTGFIKDHPWVVSLQRREVHVCGGAILNERIILTAAHCVVPLLKLPIDQVSIRAGSTLWSSGGQHIGVKTMMKHQKYDPDTKIYDIALIKLLGQLEFDVAVQPIKMATKLPGDGRNALICGWGLKKEKADMIPTMLQTANVTTISRAKCSSKDFEYHEDILETMICAKNENIDACQGDSGGPLVVGNELSGITSFGKGCGRKEYPGIYTGVATVAKWIEKYSQSL